MNDKAAVEANASFEDLLSVREAARLLRVSESTIWRWINEDALPSYRVGRKRVYLKRAELTPLLRPARMKGGNKSDMERERLNLFPMAPHREAIDQVEQALALQAKLRAKYGGQRAGPEAWEDVNEMREERSRELG